MVVSSGVAIGLAISSALSPVLGDQEKLEPPVAFSCVSSPSQMEASSLASALISELIVTVTEASASQSPLLIVTV